MEGYEAKAGRSRLGVLVERVSRMDAGEPALSDNNTLFGFDRLPLELIA